METRQSGASGQEEPAFVLEEGVEDLALEAIETVQSRSVPAAPIGS